MLSSHHYKSFKVSMIHRLRFTTDVQLGKCVNRWWTQPIMSVVNLEIGEETAYNFYVTWMTNSNLFSEKMFKQWNLRYLPFPSWVLSRLFFMKQKVRNRTDLRLFSNWLTCVKATVLSIPYFSSVLSLELLCRAATCLSILTAFIADSFMRLFGKLFNGLRSCIWTLTR